MLMVGVDPLLTLSQMRDEMFRQMRRSPIWAGWTIAERAAFVLTVKTAMSEHYRRPVEMNDGSYVACRMLSECAGRAAARKAAGAS